jgi:uncharacterized protein
MITSITVNLPVKDVTRSTAFLKTIGFQVNPMFAADPDMELVDITGGVHVMLNSETRFASISLKRLVEAATHAEAILQLRVGSREQVDELVDRALAAEAKPIHDPNNQEYVYGRSFQDLDNHNWDVFWAAQPPKEA